MMRTVVFFIFSGVIAGLVSAALLPSVALAATTSQVIETQVQRAVELRQQQKSSESEHSPQANLDSTADSNLEDRANLRAKSESRIITRYSWLNGLIKIRQQGSQYYLRVL